MEPSQVDADGQLARDRARLARAVRLSESCPRSETAFSVGAVIVAADGRVLAEGYSRDTDPLVHAEESALARVAAGEPDLRGATIYSSLEPCGMRKSRPRPCAELIVAAGIRRVVYAMRESDLFVPGGGAQALAEAGVIVVHLDELAGAVGAVNAHLLR